VRYLLRWWETLGRPERIVALSIGLAAPVAIVNSGVWAIAVCYMAHQKAKVEIERVRVHAVGDHPPEQPADAWQPTGQTPSPVSATGRTY
jgi:hypothetical protein